MKVMKGKNLKWNTQEKEKEKKKREREDESDRWEGEELKY